MPLATFRVINPETSELIKQYQVEYTDAKDLNESYQEGRQVWSEYQLEAECREFILSSSHTFREQFLIEQDREIELQFEYMSGAYEE